MIYIAGPAAPIVFGVGIALASAGLATTVTAAGFGVYFKLDRDKFNERQKEIDAQYTPLAETCKQKLDHGKETAAGAQKVAQQLKKIANDYKTIKQQLHGQK